MIARVRYDHGDGPAEAILGDDFTWQVADSDLASALNTLLATANRSPSRGRWWMPHVAKVAAMLGGTAEFEPKPAPPPGRIY